MRRFVAVAVVAVMALTACGGGDGGGVEVSDIRIGQPAGPNAALYFTAVGGEEADRLLGGSTGAAASVEVHETVMGDDGTMGMQPVDGLDLPAGGELVLEPGGYHMMLIDADRMKVGDVVEVTLSWERAGDMTVQAEVVEPGETMGHDEMDMDDGGSDG
ncbi:MAG: copper chaperone PCu(A)C [Acidimicrobiia bacterium]|jgi:copper(I)-binding protein